MKKIKYNEENDKKQNKNIEFNKNQINTNKKKIL